MTCARTLPQPPLPQPSPTSLGQGNVFAFYEVGKHSDNKFPKITANVCSRKPGANLSSVIPV